MSHVKETKLYKVLEGRGQDELLQKIDSIASWINLMYPQINRVFYNYTVHGMPHSINVMEYMYELIDDIDKMNDLDIVLCIYSALLHDIGMIVFDDEIEKIKSNKDNLEVNYNTLYLEYKNENLAIQECIRSVHGIRVEKVLKRSFNDIKCFFHMPNTTISFFDEVIKICRSHNEDIGWISENIDEDIKKSDKKANPQFVALLLRLADLLDFDEQRASLYLYNMLKPTGYSNEEWKQHFIIENKQKVGENKSFNLKELQFYGKCSDPAIYRKFLGYIDYLGAELKRCIEYSEGFEYKEYLIKLLPTPNLNINTIGFSFADFKLNLDYTAVTNLLMGENIYGDKKYGLREILQNSIDACKVYEEYHQRKLNEYDSYLPIIKIKVDEENKEIRIFDNGNGMTLDILKNYFLNIGVSYYKSKEYKFKNYGYSPIGNFGIGFLACFMLSEDVTLFTKTSTEKIGNVVKINRNSEYICFSNENLKFNHGTEIILNYDDFFKAFNDIETIETFIKNNFIDNDIPIEIIDSTKKNTLKLFKLEELLNPPINLSKDKTLKPNQPISLSNYFEDIDVLVYMRFSKSCFVETLKDLSNNNSYYYKDSDGKIYLEDRCTLKEYVENNEINYLEVAIVDDYNSTEFGTAYEYLEDYELALNKIDPEWISILYKKDQNVECGDIYFDNIVVGDYLYDNLVHDFNQSVTVPAYILNLKQKVIVGKGRKILTYVQQIRNANKNIHRNNIFCKGVLVKEAAVNIPFTLNDFYLKDIAINSKNQKIIPDVTRNSFSSEIKEELSYAVGKAVHMWILDNADLDYEEKNLLQEFVKLNYSKDSIFLKK